ncbi:hypothetical protein niasHT_014828 [Heterodera trifolii]|uniref:Uncharacterized protein n=1 Tax=Heterodera trifolii TaxID=157864 RepID=A0ABD2L764_9BILA
MVGLFIFLYLASVAEGMPRTIKKKAKSHKSSGFASSLGKGLTLALAATVPLAAGSSRQFPDIQGAVEQVAAQPPHQNKTAPQPSKMTRRKTVVVTDQNCSYVAPAADVQNVPPGETEYAAKERKKCGNVGLVKLAPQKETNGTEDYWDGF